MRSKSIPLGVLSLMLVWAILTVLCWLHPQQELSLSERRKLQTRPELTMQKITSSQFMEEFEAYTLDQFPGRDMMRTLKSVTVYYGLQQKENNGVYLTDGHAAVLDYPLQPQQVQNAAEKLDAIYRSQLAGHCAGVYLCIVPDKNYYLAQANGYPAMDYATLQQIMQTQLPYAKAIEIADLLHADDYYRTDPHWRQESLIPVAERLCQQMQVPFSGQFQMVVCDTPFYGAYSAQAALPIAPDTITYLTNSATDSCVTSSIEGWQDRPVYDLEKLQGRDPYEMFCSGAVSVMQIHSPESATDRKLIVFRDSFASSLIPLLTQSYREITLIDIRYISSDQLAPYLDAEDADVLLCYSTMILNHSTGLR